MHVNPRTLARSVTRAINGKVRHGPRCRPSYPLAQIKGDKDDMYMAMTIGLMGALYTFGNTTTHS